MEKPDFRQTRLISQIATLLYKWLPGSSPPFGRIFTFADAAQKHGLQAYWSGGSKLPSLQGLLEGAFEKACLGPLIITIVREGMKYRDKKGNSVTKEEVVLLDTAIRNLGLVLPELSSPDLLLLMRESSNVDDSKHMKNISGNRLHEFSDRYDLRETNPDVQNRGYEFQELLFDILFDLGLNPRKPFRVTGEEVDGSFTLDSEIYLLEARWRAKKAAKSDLASFSDKVERKSSWTRGLFISVHGFTEDGLEAMKMGKAPNFVIVSGKELRSVLRGELGFVDVLQKKIRSLAERGELEVQQ